MLKDILYVTSLISRPEMMNHMNHPTILSTKENSLRQEKKKYTTLYFLWNLKPGFTVLIQL